MRVGSVRSGVAVALGALVVGTIPAATAAGSHVKHIAVSLNRHSIPATGVLQPKPRHLKIHDPHHQVAQPYVVDPARPRVTARVRDGSGDPVEGAAVTFHATRDVHFGPVREHEHGRYTAAVISSTRPGRARIWATVGDVASKRARLRQTFGALHTEGTKILNSVGNPVRLRGINFQPYVPAEYLANGFPPREAFEVIHGRWNVNAVRVFVDLDQWQRSCRLTRQNDRYADHYRMAYRSFIRALTYRGIYVMLVLGTAPRVSCGDSDHYELPARIVSNRRADAVRFWHDIAAEFKSNPLVGFDLFNEPNHVGKRVWLNGGRVSATATWQAAGMQAMYNSVRFTGSKNLVFVEGPGFAARTPPALISGPASTTDGYDAPAKDIVYAAHYYTCVHHDFRYPEDGARGPYKCANGITPPAPDRSCPSGPDVPRWADPAARLDAWVSWRNTHHRPIIENEFGWPGNRHRVDKCFIRATIAYDEAHNIPWLTFQWVQWRSKLWGVAKHPADGKYHPTISGCPVYRGLTGGKSCNF